MLGASAVHADHVDGEVVALGTGLGDPAEGHRQLTAVGDLAGFEHLEKLGTQGEAGLALGVKALGQQSLGGSGVGHINVPGGIEQGAEGFQHGGIRVAVGVLPSKRAGAG